MNLVDTKLGPIDRERLTVRDIPEESPGVRTLATEWYLGDELVRRDVWVSVLLGLSIGAEAA